MLVPQDSHKARMQMQMQAREERGLYIPHVPADAVKQMIREAQKVQTVVLPSSSKQTHHPTFHP
jgi:hypothetical protein